MVESCTILTTTLWLDQACRNTTVVSEMLKPFDTTVMRRYPVSTRVNQVQNDDADWRYQRMSRTRAPRLERASEPLLRLW